MTDNLLERAASAKRESKWVDFKESFDPTRPGEWCEVVKDLVAMANSGGGAILFGIKNNGDPAEFSPESILALDAAKITDKVASYTSEQFSGFEVTELTRTAGKVAAIRIYESSFPLVFTAAGTYDSGGGRQKTAFQNGTIYFRHGAKSEPGNASDLRDSLERELGRRRRAWLGGIRKVVSAPAGHTVEVVAPGMTVTDASDAVRVRLVADSTAAPVHRLDPDTTHPYRQKEALLELNRRLGGATIITSHDNLCVRRAYGIDDTRPEFYYCSKFGSPQYSAAYVEWLHSRYQVDSDFFRKARAGNSDPGWKRMSGAGPTRTTRRIPGAVLTQDLPLLPTASRDSGESGATKA